MALQYRLGGFANYHVFPSVHLCAAVLPLDALALYLEALAGGNLGPFLFLLSPRQVGRKQENSFLGISRGVMASSPPFLE